MGFARAGRSFGRYVLQCPPQGATKDNLYVDISADSAFHPNYCIRVTDVLEREMRLAYNTDSGSFSKKRKVGKHGHSSYVVAKTSIDAFYQQRPVSKPVVHQQTIFVKFHVTK